jgi:hypothetical protein
LNRICIIGVALSAGLAACSYQIETSPTEPAPVVSAYTDKVPGKWALLIDADKASTTLEAGGVRCSQFDYPLDLTQSFGRTAQATFKTVADDVRLSDHQLSRAELASGGYMGVITIRVTELRAKVGVTGVIDTHAAAATEIDGTILVIKAGDRVVDTSESGKGEAERDAGIVCGGAADAVAAASDDAVQDVVRQFAEQFANSHAVRYSVQGLAPQ